MSFSSCFPHATYHLHATSHPHFTIFVFSTHKNSKNIKTGWKVYSSAVNSTLCYKHIQLILYSIHFTPSLILLYTPSILLNYNPKFTQDLVKIIKISSFFSKVTHIYCRLNKYLIFTFVNRKIIIHYCRSMINGFN